jgi:nuclear pore complex protein Nup93
MLPCFQGIAFLLERSAYYADAVHMAIALTYYGLLRVPADSAVNDIPNRAYLDVLPAAYTPADSLYTFIVSRGAGPDGPNTLYLNFARVIQRYTKLFSSTDPTEALQYIYLICLNSDLPPPVGPQQQQLCEDMVSNIVLDTKSYNLLLGSGDDESQISVRFFRDMLNQRDCLPVLTSRIHFQTSVVGRDLALIKVADRRAFIRQLINRAVDQTSLDLPLPDLIQLYKLAGDYNRVLHTLSKAVADSLSTPSTASELEQPDQLAGYIEQVASKLESERVPLADSAKRTLKDLLHYRKVKRFTEKGEHQPALQVNFGWNWDRSSATVSDTPTSS